MQGRIGELDPPGEAAAVDTQVVRLRELTAERTRIVELIKQASPRLAALRYPTPLGVWEAAATLDPGTLLLSYAVGDKNTTIFALRADPSKPRLDRFILPIGQGELRSRVARFTQQIATVRLVR